MAKRQSAKPDNAKGRNPDRANGKARKKNPALTGMNASTRYSMLGYSEAAIIRRAAKRTQTVAEHIDYVQNHRATKSVRHNEAKRKATV